VLTSTVLGALYVVWINPSTGFADEYVDAIERRNRCVLKVLGPL